MKGILKIEHHCNEVQQKMLFFIDSVLLKLSKMREKRSNILRVTEKVVPLQTHRSKDK